jgi:DNA adenine methylase
MLNSASRRAHGIRAVGGALLPIQPPSVDRVARYKSPLRYPGGKSSLAAFIQSIFVANDLVGGIYAEPYAGGASVALALLFENYVRQIHINDADPAVHAFWHSAVAHTDDLCRLIRDTKPTVSEWKRQRAIYSLGRRAARLQLGFAAFFLNRTNRSGIIGSAGIIGGQNQDGKWKINARYNRVELAARVERIAKFRDRIVVTGIDASIFLSRASQLLPAESLIYMDPPYYLKGERRLYANYYEPDDHAEVAEAVSRLRCNWLVSYDRVPQIRQIYRAFRSLSYSLRYSASTTSTGKEIMFFSKGLLVPIEHRPTAAVFRSARS